MVEEGRPDSFSASPAGSTPLGCSHSCCAPESPTCFRPQICLTAALGTAVGTWVPFTTTTHAHSTSKNWYGGQPLFQKFSLACATLPGQSFPGGINIPEQFLWNPKITHMPKIQHMLQHCRNCILICSGF